MFLPCACLLSILTSGAAVCEPKLFSSDPAPRWPTIALKTSGRSDNVRYPKALTLGTSPTSRIARNRQQRWSSGYDFSRRGAQ